ncbi:hypothetical protein RCL1_002928 [Eukaryota sp. TZLM3-RCL]
MSEQDPVAIPISPFSSDNAQTKYASTMNVNIKPDTCNDEFPYLLSFTSRASFVVCINSNGLMDQNTIISTPFNIPFPLQKQQFTYFYMGNQAVVLFITKTELIVYHPQWRRSMTWTIPGNSFSTISFLSSVNSLYRFLIVQCNNISREYFVRTMSLDISSDDFKFNDKNTLISASSEHTMVVKTDGTVAAMGRNLHGRLGDGTTTDRNTPTNSKVLTDIIAVSVGHSFSLALASNGNVYSTGTNGQGELGINSQLPSRNTFDQVLDVQSVVQISAGENHALAVTKDNIVYGWGSNTLGQLTSIVGSTQTYYRVVIHSAGKCIQVEAGSYHSVFLRADGSVYVAGTMNGGNGNGQNERANTPVKADIDDVVKISSKYEHVLVITTEGTVYGWGVNTNGQIGDASVTSRSSPSKVKDLIGVVTVATGRLHSLAVLANGEVWGWGSNSNYQISSKSISQSTVPIKIWTFNNAVGVAAGGGHSVVVTDEEVFTFGSNTHGQIGDGTTTTRQFPYKITPPS